MDLIPLSFYSQALVNFQLNRRLLRLHLLIERNPRHLRIGTKIPSEELKVILLLFGLLRLPRFPTSTSHLATVHNPDVLPDEPIGRDPEVHKLLQNIFSFYQLPEDHVLVVQVRPRRHRDVELGVVGVGFTEVGHSEKVGLIVFVYEVLVRESVAIYRFPTSSIAIGYISSLNHKPRNYSMDFRALVV